MWGSGQGGIVEVDVGDFGLHCYFGGMVVEVLGDIVPELFFVQFYVRLYQNPSFPLLMLQYECYWNQEEQQS